MGHVVFILISLAAIAVTYLCARSAEKYIIGVLFVSTVYYAFLGPLYWIYVRSGVYVGVAFSGDELFRAAEMVALPTALLCALMVVMNRREHVYARSRVEISPVNGGSFLENGPIFFIFLVLGLLSTLVVFTGGSQASARYAASYVTGGGGIFRIACQFANLLIPCILYDIAKRGFKLSNVVLFLYFFTFTTFTGFRSYFVQLGAPMVLYLLCSNMGRLRKISAAGAFALLMVAYFGFMAMYRTKFGGVDLSRNLAGGGISTPLDGLFQEANIIFGMVAINNSYVDNSVYILFQPFVDSIKELMPKILFPQRTSGDYLLYLLRGLYSQEALNSGTAYPWIGEYYMMFGKAGAVIGPMFVASIYTLFKKIAISTIKGTQNMLVFTFLVASMLGYYGYSRGYMPQNFKQYLFVIVPFIILAANLVPRRLMLVGVRNGNA